MRRSGGGGFPGLALVSLTALLALLAGGVLVGLRPWEPESVDPHLITGAEAAIGGAVAVERPAGPAVAAAALASAGPGSARASNARGTTTRSASRIAVSSNRPLTVAAAVPVAQPPQEGPAGAQPSPPTTVAVTAPATVPVSSSPATPAEPVVAAGFGQGPEGVRTSHGDLPPLVAMGGARDGSGYGVVRLNGDESRSQLALGGEGQTGALEIHEGDEYALAFSFYIETMVYGAPGAPNLVMELASEGTDVPAFGLQLLDWPIGSDGLGGGRGLWSSGEAMGGDRFLAPVEERAWHDVVIEFRASSQNDGFYEVLLDGRPIDARSGVRLIPPGSASAEIELGLFRDGELLQGTSELRFDSVKLGDSLESVLP